MNRGQVTLFVIIGLVVLLLIALTLLFLPDNSEQTARVNAEQLISFVETCLHTTAEEALIIAGSHGGLTRFEGRAAIEEQPWRGDTFMSGPQWTPYWYHTASCENPYGCVQFVPPPLCADQTCIFDGQYPGAGSSIQEEVEHYIQDNIHACFNNFLAVQETFTVEIEEPRAHIIFTADDVVADLTLPMTVRDEQTGALFTLERFNTRLDIDFEELYRLARDIVATEYTTNFVEENFLHFLSVYQGDSPGLPPFNDASFFGGSKIWFRSEAEERIENEVLPYLSFMQVVNAQEGYAPIMNTGIDPDDEYGQYARGLFAYAEILLADRSYPNLAASFLYPYSPIYLNINDKEVLKGEDLSSGNFLMKMAGIFIKKYEHKYDVAFPLLVTLEDDDALGGRGYTFTFALEANIVNNFPYYANRTITRIDGRTFNTLDQNTPQHHIDNEITVTVNDAYTGNPLADTLLLYECGWRAELGTTNGQGQWTGSLPFCFGGTLRAEKGIEYYPGAVAFDSQEPGQFSVDLELWKYQQKEITVFKRTVEHVERNKNPPGCVPLTSCRKELSWGGTQEMSRHLVDGTTVTNETEQCAGTGEYAGIECQHENTSVADDQYALVTINRLPAPDDLVRDPAPLVSAFTFGDEDGQPVIDAYFDLEMLETLRDNGNISAEDYTFLVEETVQHTQQTINLSRTQEIQLIPGTYSINAMLFYNGNLTIPEERRKVGPFFNRQTIVLPEQNFQTWLQGGAQFTDQPVTFTPEQVYGDEPLVIYVLEQKLPTSWTDLEENYQPVEEYQEDKTILALPRFEE